MAKSCLDRYKKIIRVTRTVAKICGADVFAEAYKMNFLTWLVVIAINSYFVCTIYTIYIGFVVNGDWKIILESLSLAGSAIQGYGKLIIGIKVRKILCSMNEELENIYREYQRHDEYLTVLRYRIDLTTKFLKTVVVLYIATGLTIICYPIIYGMLNNEKLLIMKFYLPGLDPTTDTGHLIHNIIHGILISLGAFGNFAGDIFIFVTISHVPLWGDILKIKFQKLNRVALGKTDSKETLPILREITTCHQAYNIYTQEVDEAYGVVIFIQVFTSVICISCTLFSILIRSWPAAFVYLFYSTCLLYAFCGLGHMVETSNDELVDIIYGECLWYELTVAEQKIILLMLRKSQSPVTLTVGQIMPLSMSTALQLTKAIYSYMMMLINFLEGEEI